MAFVTPLTGTPAIEDGWSRSVVQLWGKARDPAGGWLPLWRHLVDSAQVADLLWDEWLPTAVRRRIAAELPGGQADGRTLVRWLAGVHDIGKATPAFAIQAKHLVDGMCGHGFAFDTQVRADRRLAPHGTAGHVVLGDWLVRRHGWAPDQVTPFAVVVGGHHGVPPTHDDLTCVLDRPDLVGSSGAWPGARDELLDRITSWTGADRRLVEWRETRLSPPVQTLLTGIVIVADWIASNEEWFPYGAGVHTADRVARAWEELDLPTPWRATAPPADPAALFASRFTLPAGAHPHPVQLAAVEVARTMPVPGLLIVEAPMGEGKTEAALAAAEILAGRSGAGGMFVALPTRATSDAMFARVLRWLARLPDADVDRGARDVALVHGKASLNTDFTTLYRHTLPSGIGVDTSGADTGGCAVAVHRWLAGRKRKLLSSFAIGTIDQLLFAALRSRHLALRHLGLAGKVVIIDEAHAYDVYMSRYLDRALHWLAAHGAPVVVLSATLPAGRRAEMMAAYDEGRLGPLPRRSSRSRPSWARSVAQPTTGTDSYAELRADLRYPLLSVSGADREPRAVACPGAGRTTEVRLARHDDDPATLADTLREALRDGGCALVVHNTVARVQRTAAVLREHLPDLPVSVAHSRFMAPDRAAKDRWLRDTFGPPDHLAAIGTSRPARHVVVASQVAEQSLDIDFDLLVTDLAPVDLVLQRLGRVHRHARAVRPAPVATPRCLLTGADWAATPPRPVAGSVRIYGRHALLRSAAVLWPHLAGDSPAMLPDHIAPLVQSAYGDGSVGPAAWQPDLAEAAARAEQRDHDRRRRADAFLLGPVRPGGSLVGWLDGAVGDAEGGRADARGRAHVRDDGAEALEVLMLVRRGDTLVTPPWLAQDGDVAVPTDFEPPPWMARAIASCTLPLPRMMTTGDGLDRVIAELEHRNPFPAWQKNPWLGGELVLDLNARGHAELTGFTLDYDQHDGLRVTRPGDGP